MVPPIGLWATIHFVLLFVAGAILVVAGQGQHFFLDEWAFVGGKLDPFPFPDNYLQSHNEHWTLLPLLAYRAFGATVGLGSYWPYLGLLLLLHLCVTHVLWRLMLLTGSKPIVATSLAAVFSVLGSAAEDLVWAFQITFVGSTLLGLGAVYLTVTGSASWRKTFVLACLIIASLASSGIGLAYLIVLPFVLAQRRPRCAAVAFCLPLLVYVTWFALYGRSLTHPPVASITLPLVVAAFVMVGLVAALTGLFGFGISNPELWLAVGVPILAALTLACRGWIADRTLAGRMLSVMCLGAVAFLGSAGLARGEWGLGLANSARYVYVVIALLLPAIGFVISRGAYRHPRFIRAVVPVAIAMAISNTLQLMVFAAKTRQENEISRQVLVAASDLVRVDNTFFANQVPEPLLAPDLTTADLRSRHLDSVFEDVRPELSDRLTASLNLQIQVTPTRAEGASSTCRKTLAKRITVTTSTAASPSFRLEAKAQVALNLQDGGSQSAERLIVLAKGDYTVNSLRRPGDLTIEGRSPSSLLAAC